mgnify:CR=1 FL=1
MKRNSLIICRGGGDLATGIVHRLHRAGFRVLVLETDHPAAIRRQVSFCEAVYEGKATVEGVTAQRIDSVSEMEEVFAGGCVPLFVDSKGASIAELHPDVVVDAIIAKKNLGTTKEMAPLVIGVGPGFTAGVDVDLVIESMRGHNLARILEEGSALPNTGIPGAIAGVAKERVIHAECAGILYGEKKISDYVQKDEVIAFIYPDTQGKDASGQEKKDGAFAVRATISGILRGLIRDGYPVTKGFKIADIDPRESEYENCFTISDKARCIAGGVLEALLHAGILPE